jgi:hypothetical protein
MSMKVTQAPASADQTHRVDMTNSQPAGAVGNREVDVSGVAQSRIPCPRVNCARLSGRQLCVGATVGILIAVFCIALGLSLNNK